MRPAPCKVRQRRVNSIFVYDMRVVLFFVAVVFATRIDARAVRLSAWSIALRTLRHREAGPLRLEIAEPRLLARVAQVEFRGAERAVHPPSVCY